jgi:hypothetical protein
MNTTPNYQELWEYERALLKGSLRYLEEDADFMPPESRNREIHDCQARLNIMRWNEQIQREDPSDWARMYRGVVNA